jgi:RNA polymerase sigma-70 factor, ECF subfamily
MDNETSETPLPARDLLNDLLAKVALGDRNAFEQLYRVSAPKLFGLALRILNNRDLAEEVLQEAFVQVWQNAATFSQLRGAAMAWLAGIVRYRALDALRRRGRPTLDIDEVSEFVADSATDPMQAGIDASLARAMRDCLESLDGSQRQSIVLAFYHGLSHSELAQHLGQKLGTVKSWVRRGLAQLRDCLER